jgi:hypothetical protein
MRNYNDQVEAAYLTSRRQGDMVRNPQQERSPHEDRSNRYVPEEYRGSNQFSQFNPYYRHSTSDQPRMKSDYRGVGPKNYKRSDERIRELVCDKFCDDPHLDASGLEVEVKNGEVILSGTVEHRHAKRLAEDLAESISGVTHIENRIRVDNTYVQSQKDPEKIEVAVV